MHIPSTSKNCLSKSLWHVILFISNMEEIKLDSDLMITKIWLWKKLQVSDLSMTALGGQIYVNKPVHMTVCVRPILTGLVSSF